MNHLPAHMQRRALSRALVRAHNESPLRVTEERTRAALLFLDALPDTAAQPIMSIALDGELFFLWEQGDKCLAIVPQTDGKLRLSAHFGREERAGAETFVSPYLPPLVAKLINAFQREDA